MFADIRLMLLRRRQRALQREITYIQSGLAYGHQRLRDLESAERGVSRDIAKAELTLGRIACP